MMKWLVLFVIVEIVSLFIVWADQRVGLGRTAVIASWCNSCTRKKIRRVVGAVRSRVIEKRHYSV